MMCDGIFFIWGGDCFHLFTSKQTRPSSPPAKVAE
jgi:hypothetical protein